MKPSPADLVAKLLASDPYLKPYGNALLRRIQKTHETEAWLTQGEISLEDFASGHEYFGLHFKNINGFSENGHLTRQSFISLGI